MIFAVPACERFGFWTEERTTRERRESQQPRLRAGVFFQKMLLVSHGRVYSSPWQQEMSVEVSFCNSFVKFVRSIYCHSLNLNLEVAIGYIQNVVWLRSACRLGYSIAAGVFKCPACNSRSSSADGTQKNPTQPQMVPSTAMKMKTKKRNYPKFVSFVRFNETQKTHSIVHILVTNLK